LIEPNTTIIGYSSRPFLRRRLFGSVSRHRCSFSGAARGLRPQPFTVKTSPALKPDGHEESLMLEWLRPMLQTHKNG